MSRLRVAGALALAALGAGCERPPADAVATYAGGSVTQQELEERIRSLPAAERRPAEGDAAAWRRQLARDLAIEKILLAEAKGARRDERPDLAARLADIERQVAVSAYLEQHLGPPTPPTEEELRAAYEERRAAVPQAERREVFHIFRRVAEGEDPDAARSDLAALGERARAGESFPLLAREHSQSETRHRDGFMGWFARGDLPPELEEVVFALAPRTPSEVLRTATGLHLFWVESIAGGRDYTFEEVRATLSRRLAEGRRNAAAQELVRREPPPGSFVPSPEELATILAGGDSQSLVLRVGDLEVRLAELRRRLAELAARGGPVPNPADYVRGLELRELLFLQCREEGCDERPEVQERTAALRDEALAQHELHQRLLESVLADRPALERYFADNRGRYGEPVRWTLARASIPAGESPNERMRRLEEAVAALDRGERTLETLAAELGGRVERLEGRTRAALEADSALLAQFASRLAPGRHSPPYRRGEGFEIVRCEERTAPTPLPLDRVERRVAEDLLNHHGQEIYEAYAERLLAARDFRLLEE